jgi:hypothetical protein
MRFYDLLPLALVCVVLTWSACEDDDPPTDCSFDLPALELTDNGSCTPNLLRFDGLDQALPATDPALPSDCWNTNSLARKAQLLLPPGDQMDLHIYNGTRGILYIQVFGATDCDQNITALTPCTTVTDAASLLKIYGLSDYDQAFVRIDFTNADGSPMTTEPEDFVSIATYVKSPTGQSVPYTGISPQNENRRISKTCGGSSYQRLLLFTCDPQADLQAWVQETGLRESESYSGSGGQVSAVDVPPGLDPNTVGPAVSRKRLDRNGDDFIVEQDFIITISTPGGSNQLPDFEQLINKEPENIFECLVYKPGKASSEDPQNQMRVTMIDTGVELGGAWDDEWNRHINLTSSDAFLQPNKLGYDFYYGDSEPEDNISHGTNTAGALIGNYRGRLPFTVIHYKVFGEEGESTYFGALVALFSAVDVGSNIINCSWGYVDNNTPRAMECAINYARSKGTYVVASAGNSTQDIGIGASPQWPGSFAEKFDNVITVASYQYNNTEVTESPELSFFSNFGNPSVSVAAYLTAKTPTYGGNSFNFKAGTSISAPLIASALASSLGETGDDSAYRFSLLESAAFMDQVVKNNYLPVCLGIGK